ncbi:MAG: beta strand repeat-containing protein, partial [Crocinitomicaceae bacterium]
WNGNAWGQCSNTGISGTACSAAGGTTVATISTTGSVTIDQWQTSSTTTTNTSLTFVFSSVAAGTAIQIASSTAGDAEFTITGPSGFTLLQVDADAETTGLGTTPNALDETATFLCTVAGEYRVRVSRHGNCATWTTAATRYLYWRVRGRTPAAFTISGPTAPCVNVSQTYTAVGGSGTETWTFPANFSGSGNSASVTRTPTSTATGTISCTRQIGCGSIVSASNTISVAPVTAPTATAGSALSAICSGATSAQMGGSATGAGGATWSGGAGSWTNANNASTATYTAGAAESGTITLTLTSTAGNCTNATSSKTITVNALATAGTIQNTSNAQITNGSTVTICEGSTITANNLASPTAGSGTLGVVWYCGELLSGSPGATGTYGNWVSSGAPSISDWPLSTSVLTAVGGVQGSGTSLTNYNPQSDFPGKTNFYIIRRAYNSNCRACAGSCQDQYFFLNLNSLPTVSSSVTESSGTANNDGTVCNGANVTLAGSGASSYSWSGGISNNVAFTASSTTTYTVTGTDANGCQNTANRTVTVNSIPSAPVITGPICPGATSVSGTGVAGSSVVLSVGGVAQAAVTVDGSGNWTRSVASLSAGNSLTATQTVTGCVSAASSAYVVITPASWGNIQWPTSQPQSICGSPVTFYGQVYRAGTTEAAGQGASLTADLGWSSTNTNPNTWTNWTSATFHSQQGNNDEFRADLGAGLTQGTWYYAFRYSYAGCPIYGGYGGVYGSGGSNGTATVPASQTATLSSSAGTNAQTVCKGTAITNITYTLGNGADNATLSAGSLPSGVSASVSGGVLTITGTPSSSGTFSYTYTTSGTSNCAFNFVGSITVNETLDYVNLQFPATATICAGGNANIYGQVYEPGLTEAGGAGAGITAQYGYSSANTNPSGGGWTWTNASFNTQSGNNDEYIGTFGSSLAAGTYYYTMRYTYNGCTAYGGFNSGAWNGTTNVNGTLTVNAAATATAGTAVSTCSNSGAVNITAGSSASNNVGTTWTSSGTGSFANATSLTTCTYTPSAADISAGSVTLTLTATGNTSCSNATSTKTLTITAAPTASAGTAITTCPVSVAVSIVTGASATNNAGTAWTSSGTGTFSATNTVSSSSYTPSAADISAGSVTLTLTATGNGTCANATSNKTLTINAAPAAPTASNNSRCGTGTVAISASSAGAVIDWYAATSGGSVLTTGTPNPASGTNSFTTPSIAATTTYYAEARNATTGCLSSSRTAVTATVNTLPTVTFTAQPGATGCTNTDLTYTTQSGQSNYTWTFPGTLNTDYTITSGGTSSSNTVVLKYLTTGSKTVTVNYSSSGCSAASATSSTATTISASPTVNAGTSFNMCSGQTVPLNGSTNATSSSGSASATYSSGNGSTLFSGSPTTATISSCPIPLSVTIPVGAVITGVNVSYTMTAAAQGWKEDQRSYIRCTNVGGIAESAINSGTGQTTGSQAYSRNNLTIANGVSGGGTVNFQLHAFRTFSGSTCATTDNYVNNNTFTITVNYTLNPTYAWTPATGLSATNVLNPNCSATTTQTYTLTVTGTNGCSASNQVVATVAGSAPAAPTASTSTPQINVGGKATLTSSAGAS